MSLGSRIKERREQLGMSRNELAELIGVTAPAIGNYETGYSTPKIELLYKIFDALQCDPNYLYQDEISAASNGTLSEREQELINNYRKLNEGNKEKIERAVRYLLDSEEFEEMFEKAGGKKEELA